MRYVRARCGYQAGGVKAIKLSARKMSNIGQLAKTAACAGGCKSLKLNGGEEVERILCFRAGPQLAAGVLVVRSMSGRFGF